MVVASGGSDRKPDPDQTLHARIATAGPEADVGPEAEAREQQRHARKTRSEPVERAANVFYLTTTFVMRALAEPGPAKVEAQHGQPEVREGLGGVIDHLVVHGPTAQRMRMGHQRRIRSARPAGVEQGFQSSRGAAQIVYGLHLRAKGQVVGHPCSVAAEPAETANPVCWARMRIDPIELTKQLVALDSTTYHEGVCGEFLEQILEGSGWAVERMPVPHPDPVKTPGAATGPRFNVYANGPGGVPRVVLSTHMDTVPPFLGPPREDETHLYGRGVCDAKGIIAAQIAAAEALRAEHLPVALLFVVGEERDSAGAKVANEQPRGSRYLINGEPTDNRLALASKGCLRVELHAHGTMAHSAYPELGDSAIDRLLGALHDIQALELPVIEGIGDTTLNVGLISGGRAPNVIADSAEAHLLVRLVGPSQGIREAITTAVAGRCEVDFSLELPFVQMRAVEGFETMVAKFTTDIPSLTNWGEPFLLGPGSIHTAHTPDERIAKADILEAVTLYVRLARQLCAASEGNDA